MSKKPKPPFYVELDGTTFRRAKPTGWETNNESEKYYSKPSDLWVWFYRDAGAWGFKIKWDGEKWVVDQCTVETLIGMPVTEVTRKQYLNDNRGYV